MVEWIGRHLTRASAGIQPLSESALPDQQARSTRKSGWLRITALLLLIGLVLSVATAPTLPVNVLWFGSNGGSQDFVLVVDSEASFAPDAMQATSQRVTQLLASASTFGLAHPEVKTTGVSVLPQTDSSGANIVGYRAVNQIVVSGASSDAAQALLAEAQEMGLAVLQEPADQATLATGNNPENWNLQWFQLG